MNLCVITPPLAHCLLLVNFLHVLEPISDNLWLITGVYPAEDIFSAKIKYNKVKNVYKKQFIIIRIFNNAYVQVQMAWLLIKHSRKINSVLFFLDGGSLVFPMIVARLLKKSPVSVVTHSSSQIAGQIKKNGQGGKFRQFILSTLEHLSHSLAFRLVVYSPSMISNMNLQKFRNKIIIAHEQYIDFNRFSCINYINDRRIIIGFVGRLSYEKGVLNLIRAIPIINQKRDDIKFTFIGDGPLKNQVNSLLTEMNLHDQVNLPGQVAHDDVYKNLNEMKLLVIPSYTEGLANVALEALACGTPVLATPVGAIPDFIKDGETGFIMENNSPQCIAQNILRAINHPGLENVVAKGHKLVEKEFAFARAVEGYRHILNELK